MPVVLAIALLIVPWLNPFASGPSPAVAPWLLSAACAVALWVLWTWERLHGPVTAAAWAPRIEAAWLAAALVSSVIALCQYFGAAQYFTPLMTVPPPGEAYANLRQRNQLASLTMIGMATLMWWRSPGLKRGYAIPAVVLLAAANAASASRTGFMQMLMLAIVAAAWQGPGRRERLRLWLAGAAGYVLAALVLPELLHALTGATAPNVWRRLAGADGCGSRIVLWSNVLHLIAQKPWFGWGWGELDYAHYVTLYDGPRFCDILDNAHNLPLHLAVELGVPAALLICGGFGWLVLRAKPWRETDPMRQMAWCVLAVILLHSMLEYPLWYGPFQIAFVLCLWLLWPAARRSADSPSTSQAAAALARLSFAALVLLALGYAAWDYRRVGQIYLPPETRAAGYADPLPEIRKSWLFRDQASFAELTITPLTHENAQWTFDAAAALLHYSPEPRVIEKLIESGIVLGRPDDALLHLARFRAAFPEAYAKWSETRGGPAAAGSAAGAQPAT
jgi:O-antigen ligase